MIERPSVSVQIRLPASAMCPCTVVSNAYNTPEIVDLLFTISKQIPLQHFRFWWMDNLNNSKFVKLLLVSISLNFLALMGSILGGILMFGPVYRRASTGLNRIWISSQCRRKRRRRHRAQLGDPARVQLLLLLVLLPHLRQQLAVRCADQQLLRRQSRLPMPRCYGMTLGVIQ